MLDNSNKIVFICSLKFAPGLFKEFTLLGDNFRNNNYAVEYIISDGYKSHFKERKIINFTKSKNTKEMYFDLLIFPYYIFKMFGLLKQLKNKDVKFLFYNPHPLNPLLQYVIKIFSKSSVITVLHEPYKTNKERMEYGLGGYIFFSIVNIFQLMSIHISDSIITMSPYGKDLFLKYFSKLQHKQISANLLLPSVDYISYERQYFSFIGRVNKGKGITDFINAINYCIDNNIYKYNFMLITSSTIDEYINQLNEGWKTILTIINHNNITDKEINNVILKSKAVFVLHQTASQSGVLPLAYQLHTPVIARNLTAFSQYFNNSGVLLDNSFSSNNLIEACHQVHINFDIYSENAIELYQNNFSEDNFNLFYKELL